MIEGNILRVKMFTKRIEVNVPDGINQIWIERFWLNGSESEPLAWRVFHESSDWKPHHPEDAIAVNPGQTIEIASDLVVFPVINKRMERKLRLWSMGRRQLTEVRDRLAPVLKWVSMRISGR